MRLCTPVSSINPCLGTKTYLTQRPVKALVPVPHQQCVPDSGHRLFNLVRVLAHYLDVLENRILLGLIHCKGAESVVAKHHLPTGWTRIDRGFHCSSVLEPAFGALETHDMLAIARQPNWSGLIMLKICMIADRATFFAEFEPDRTWLI